MKQKQAKFDDPARWWFLTVDGFAAFKNNPVAQGYEILSRHPGFPHVLADGWEHANKHRPRKTWRELGKSARTTFLIQHKFDLHRMGLLSIAWLGPKAITFDCTEGVPSILDAARLWLAAGRIKGAGGRLLCSDDYELRSWSAPGLIKLVMPTGNPDMVTLDWERLFQKCFYVGEVIAALRTFLDKDPEYRKHRQARLVEKKKQHQRRKQRLAGLGKVLPPARTNKPPAATIALACAALDCQEGGSLLRDKITASQLTTIGLGKFKVSDPRNYLKRLRDLQMLARFKIPELTTRPAKRTPANVAPINVVSTLYPDFPW
jgi:hypothetical protein